MGQLFPFPFPGTTATHTPPLPASGEKKREEEEEEEEENGLLDHACNRLLQLCLIDSFAWYLMNLLSTQIFNYKMPGSNIDYSLKDYSKGNP